jgi:hypothetical protein
MKGISLNVIRLSKCYRLVNFGEIYEFEVMQFLEEDNYRLKDLLTLESYEMRSLIQFGKGEDFSLEEM